jgi:uncharacterized protein YkwD
MRLRVLFGTLAAMCAATSAHGQTDYERAVLTALNAARTDPAAYAAGLKTYRTYFHAKLVRMPGQKVDVETEEGVTVVDETIAFLGNQAALAPVEAASILRASAQDHVSEQSHSGNTGHDGDDGSSPGDRVRRRGGGAFVAEVIAYGPLDAEDAVRQLIVDDGVADRGHRGIIFAPELRFAGVSCGPHPDYRTMCVIDLGVTPDARDPGPIETAAR